MNKAIDKMVNDLETMKKDLICELSDIEDSISSLNNESDSKKNELILLTNIVKFLKTLKK